MKLLLIASLLLTTVSTSVIAENKANANDNLNLQEPKIVTSMNPSLLELIQAKGIPAVGVGYLSEGKMTELVVGELEKGRAAPVNAIWNVASLTKPVTALVALKLINEGKLSLDEPVSKYFIDPDIKDDPRLQKLTIRFILSHQTGFPNWRYSEPNKKLRFQTTPGTQYQYSGEGYEYLRKVIEKRLGKDFNAIAQAYVFQPLGMKNTSYVWSESAHASRFAKGHQSDLKPYETEKNDKANGADNLLTTVEDYLKFVNHIMNGAGLKNDLLKEMTTGQVRINPYKSFGLGWVIDENIDDNKNGKGKIALVHSGADEGVRTIAFLIPKTNKALVIFTNSDNGADVYKDLLLHFLKEDGAGILKIEMAK